MRAALLLMLLADPAHAACQGDNAFSCQIGTKTLQVCSWDGTLIYSFGTDKTPDLTLAEPLETVEYVPWSGWGRNRFHTVTFHNVGFSYEVWSGFDRIGDPRGTEGGVIVRNGTATVAQLTCDTGTVTRELDSIGGLKSDIGQCFDQKLYSWRAGPCGSNPEFCAC